MFMVSQERAVVVAGGGNGAHVAAATIAHRTGRQVVWYVPYANEVQVIGQALAAPPQSLTVSSPSGGFEVPGRHLLTTGDPSLAAQASLVLLVAPAFAHRPLLHELGPHLQPGTAVGAIPSRGGFEFELDELAPRGIVSFGLQTLPWACRTESAGRLVRVLGTKNQTYMGCRPLSFAHELAETLTACLGATIVPGGGLLAMTLANTGQLLHPGLMTVHIRRWQQGAWPTDGGVPLFYQDAGDEGAELVAAMSREMLTIAGAITAASGDTMDLGTVTDVFTWLRRCYDGQLDDHSSFSRALATNRAYHGIRVPVVREPAPRPDFTARYLTEDVPFGLAVSKGLAELAGVETPVIDGVLAETGTWLGTPFVDGGGLLSSEGLSRTRAPQRFGIITLARALAGEGESSLALGGISRS